MAVDVEKMRLRAEEHAFACERDPNFWVELNYLAHLDPQPGEVKTPWGQDAFERHCDLVETADWISRRYR